MYSSNRIKGMNQLSCQAEQYFLWLKNTNAQAAASSLLYIALHYLSDGQFPPRD